MNANNAVRKTKQQHNYLFPFQNCTHDNKFIEGTAEKCNCHNIVYTVAENTV